MSEELNVEQNVDAAPEQAPQTSEMESQALQMGWRPKEEFNGPEDAFIDAKEFVRRQPLFDKISQQSREIKEVRKALEAFKLHYTTVKETEYNRALDQLKDARKAALSDGDGDRFEAIDKEIKNVETQVTAIKQAQEIPLVKDEVVHPEFQAWQNQNRWYTETKYMREYADEYGAKLAASGMTPSDVLQAVSKAVKKEFPHKFVNANKAGAPNVESGSTGGKSGGKFTEANLTDFQRQVMNTLVRSGTLTKEKYLADIAAQEKKQ
jgi:hypothetical protein